MGEWEAFERRYGPLLLHERVDFASAQVAWITARMGGASEAKLEHFMPNWRGERRSGQSEEQMIAALKSMAKKKPGGTP